MFKGFGFKTPPRRIVVHCLERRIFGTTSRLVVSFACNENKLPKFCMLVRGQK